MTTNNQTITELSGHDVRFDQTIESDSIIAAAGGVAINGSVRDSAVNTGINTGIMAGDDVDLDESTVGNGNVQFTESNVGAFAQGGDATNIEGHNVNMGKGDLIDVETGRGDAQVVNGHGNQVMGDIDVDAEGSDGPTNFVFGSGNRANALEDNSENVSDSFNVDKSVEDSYNTKYEDSYNLDKQDNDTKTTTIEDSYNVHEEDNDKHLTSMEWTETDNSIHEDNDSWSADFEYQELEVDLHHADGNELDFHG
ncbi:MAG: hypothetical protein ACKV2O_24530 [Acidimicrobiales bacterium]